MAALTPLQEKDQRLRMRRFVLAAIASGLTVLIAALMALTGYLAVDAVIVYSILVIASALAFYVMFRTDANMRFGDPTLTVPQLVAAGLAITYLVYESGAIRAVPMAMYLMAFLFGMFTLSVRGMINLAIFYVGCYVLAIAATAWLQPEALDVKREVVRAAGFTLLLCWIAYMSAHVNGLRRHLRESNRKLTEALARYQWVANLSSDWYWEQDAEQRFTRIDGGRQRRFEISPEDISTMVGTRVSFRDFEIVRRDRQGEIMQAALVSGEPVLDENGAFAGYRGVGRDITERKRMEETITRMAAYDELTGLPNARYLSNQLAKTIAESKRETRRFALLYCDLDGFKPVNDAMGHAAGDALLRELAVRLQTTLREADLVARVGGDEFVAIGTTCHSVEDAGLFAERIHRAVEDPFHVDGKRQAKISCSIGIAVYPDHGATANDLLRAADHAMYAAKRAGRARHMIADAAPTQITQF